ncbi:MAG TPA: methylated-DNA--[protein]-cysteine S-methyltransferase [Candidatus Dependentiae bacterium]|nr:methylated-DNA--[protein]-cysteine S-methyltransferase [Candidatus Dependentiae bacterium]HRQ62898.1 methylated-DNA--[protein]-cysteine S-methyltransferase [Candidatus Dependentiae bacterium]
MNILKLSYLETPIGNMVAIANDDVLYMLEFADSKRLEQKVNLVRSRISSEIIVGRTNPIASIEHELQGYFAGNVQQFTTPLFVWGSHFQQMVWQELQKIPYGQTKSYAHVASSIGRPTAYRAVAQANGANMFCIAIACHRVINADGGLGGYAGGVKQKKWLLAHEKNINTYIS